MQSKMEGSIGCYEEERQYEGTKGMDSKRGWKQMRRAARGGK